MTGLDQAFIKAYMQKDGASAEPPDSAKPVLPSCVTDEQPSPRRADRSAPVAPKKLLDMIEQPSEQGDDSPAPSTASSTARSTVPTAKCETPESKKPEAKRRQTEEARVAKHKVPAFLRTGTNLDGATLAASGEDGTPRRQSFDTLDLPDRAQCAKSVRRIDPAPTLPPTSATDGSPVPAPHSPIESTKRPDDAAEAAKTETSDSAATDILPFEDSPAAVDCDGADCDGADCDGAEPDRVEFAEAEGASDDSGPIDRSFLPMLQVERYTLPKTCLRLDKVAGSALDRLTDGITAAMARRHRVLAIGACRRGEGATTMLLCAAQRLIRRGLRIVMVDAQFQEPRLASTLGLAPEFGWEDVLAGRLPLEDVAIEAIDSRLTFLPCCRPLGPADRSPETESRMARNLRTLRENFDLVLVDMDPLDEKTLNTGLSDDAAQAGTSLDRAIFAQIEAVMLVHDTSTTPPHHLGAVQRRLAATGIASAGVVENFVPN